MGLRQAESSSKQQTKIGTKRLKNATLGRAWQNLTQKMNTEVHSEELMKLVHFFESELQASLFHMVEFTYRYVITWLFTSSEILYLEAQAQVNQEIIARIEVFGELLLQHTLVDQGLDTLTGTTIHNPRLHG